MTRARVAYGMTRQCCHVYQIPLASQLPEPTSVKRFEAIIVIVILEMMQTGGTLQDEAGVRIVTTGDTPNGWR